MIIKLKNDLLITLMMFLFVFNISFVFLPFGTSKIFAIIGLMLIFLHIIINQKLIFFNNKDFRFFFKYSLFLLFSSIFFAVIHGTFDFKLTYSYFLFNIEHLLGSATILYFINKKKIITIDSLLKNILAICFIQSWIVLFMLFSEKFKFYIYSILDIGEMLYNMGLRYDGIRGLGMAANTTYELSFVLSIGLMIAVYLVDRAKNSKELLKLSFMYIVVLFATLVVARTGWIGFFLSILLFLFNNKRKLKQYKTKNNRIKFILMILILCSCFAIFLSLMFNDIILVVQEKVIPFVFEFFINLYGNNSFQTDSTNILMSMYFPVSLKTFLVGDGRYISQTGTEYYMGTDGGYMRHLLFCGVFSIFLYVFYYNIFKRILRNIKNLKRNVLNSLIYFMGVYYLLVQFKGDILTGGNIEIKIITLIYLASSFKSNEK